MCMIVDKSVIEWHDVSEKPTDSWIEVLVICVSSTEYDILPAYWSKGEGKFASESYPFDFADDEILLWAYYPKVDSLLARCKTAE